MSDATNPAPSCLDWTLREFLQRAGAKEPTPGGGSVSAIVAAAGCRLVLMSARYSRARKELAEHAEALDAFIARMERAADLLALLADEDMAAYRAYSAARSQRGESAEARAAWQRAVLTAASVPLEVAAVSAAALGETEAVKDRISRYLISDLTGGGLLLAAAARSAALNVRVNLPDLEDAETASRLTSELARTLERARRLEAALTASAERLLAGP